MQRRRFRARSRAPRRREVRRPQFLGQVHLRRRHPDRPLAPARRADRRRGAPGLRRGRQPPRRPRPRGDGLRPRDDGRHGLAHGRRRPHARRRFRPPRAALRACARQRQGRRHRDRGRAAPARERGGKSRPLLGGPRRRRKFRHRHGLRVRPAPDAAADHRRRHRVPDRRGRASCSSSMASTATSAPDEPYCDCRAWTLPIGGKPGTFTIHTTWSGPASDADRVLAPLRKLGKPLE